MPLKYKLTYWDGKGRGELTRLVFAAAGVKYEDFRIPPGSPDWLKLKPNTPWGSIPTLTVNGKNVYGQSLCVARFIAKETGLAGKSAEEQLLADSIVTSLNEYLDKLIELWFVDAARKKELQEKFDTGLETTLNNILKMFEANNGAKGFLVGSGLTWADLHFYHVIESIKIPNKFQTGNPDALKKFPKFEELYTKISKIPKVAEHIKKYS